MKRFGRSLFAAMLAFTAHAQAGSIFAGSLSGQGTASGFVAVTLDGLQGALELTFNLSSPIASGSGIYDETETTLLYPLTIPLSPTSTGTIDQVITFASQDIATLLAGDLYFDVLSQNSPAVPGEIGAELVLAPEPATGALLLIGIAMVAAWRAMKPARKPAAA